MLLLTDRHYGGWSLPLSVADLSLSKYAAVTKGQKDLISKFKSALGLPHPPTEAEKSEALQKNAEKEEQEHQDRIKAVNEAERGENDDEARARARREVLYGRLRWGSWEVVN